VKSPADLDAARALIAAHSTVLSSGTSATGADQ